MLFIEACASRHSEDGLHFDSSGSVSRQDTLKIAEAYYTHRWVPTKANIFHGVDKEGIRVDTPDIAYNHPDAERPGWWLANKKNIGIPYMWGGFDTPATFDQKLSAGFYAGDIYSSEKRRLLDNGVSLQACGIDCSGFISRCWRLERSFSTRELPALSDELSSFDELQPGDIVNLPNVHCLLFVKFLDANHKKFLAYETGSPPSWKVLKHPISVEYVKGLGYRPYRYKNIEAIE